MRLVASLLFLLCLGASVAWAQEEKVKVALLMINADAGVFIALERGLFKEQGLAVEPIYFSSSGGPQMLTLTNGDLDAGSGSVSPGIYNAVAGGVGLKVVATKSRVGPKGSGKFIVRSSLIEAGKPFGIRDVKGRVVALNSAVGTSRMYLDGFLKRGGLSEADVTTLVMPFGDMANALANRLIDAAFMVQPFATHVEEKGIGAAVIDLADVFLGHMTNNLFYADSFIRSRPRVAERFMTALLKGQRLFNDAQVRQTAALDDVVDMVVKHLRIKDKK